MEKYQNFIETIDLLKGAVDKMAKVKTRQEVEQLELDTRSYFNAMIVKASHIQSDIHAHAAKCIANITANDAKKTLK